MANNTKELEIPAGLVEDTPEHTITTLSNCFNNDTFQRYLVFDYLNIPDTEKLVASMNQKAFGEFIPAIMSDGGLLVTFPGSAITSVW